MNNSSTGLIVLVCIVHRHIGLTQWCARSAYSRSTLPPTFLQSAKEYACKHFMVLVLVFPMIVYAASGKISFGYVTTALLIFMIINRRSILLSPMIMHRKKIYEELVDMKSKIANMEKTLSTMCAQPRDSISSMPSVPRHSTPIRSTKLYDGSKINASRSIQENSFQHASNSDSPIHHSEEMFSLFLTNIDGRVTENEINVLVSESCGLKENRTFRIKKLVPKWKIDEPPDYASFKVTVEGKYKRLLLREDAWPIGIKYREFIERPRNIWKPCRY